MIGPKIALASYIRCGFNILSFKTTAADKDLNTQVEK